MRRSNSWMLVVAAVAVLWMALVSRYFPAAGEYQVSADEGVYFRQAATIVDHGLRGFSELARTYVAERSDLPSPLRIGHILLSAAALSVNRSFAALSFFSALCHAATFLVVIVFARKLWGERIAAVAGLLVLSSPLASGLALRALADTHFCLANVLALLAFVAVIVHGAQRLVWVFAVALGWSLLVKETSYWLLPFYGGVLVSDRVTNQPARSHRMHLGLTLALVPLLTLAASMALLGGPRQFYEVVRTATTVNATEPHPYLEAFGSGPWFEYFVDLLLLSPLTALLFIGFCGHFITSANKSRATALLLSFSAFYLAVLAALPKNPRFVLPLDPLLRIGAASMLVVLTQRPSKTKMCAELVLAAALLTLVAVDVRAFERYFVTGKIYDPVAYNLLATAKMIPSKKETQTPDAYLALSLRRYQAHDYAASIVASQEALRLRPADADAYNNLGLAYAELGHWSLAIAALEEAIRLRPSYQLAKNNLAWIRARAAAAPAPAPAPAP